MGRRPRTFQPNAVLESAIYSGLAALARGRVRSKKKKHYKSIDTNWLKAWTDWDESRIYDPYDYSSIQNAEPNLRGIFFKILWQTTKRYGNTETKRVYSWQEGTVGPLNALLNFAGARLRDLALTYYPFPQPVEYEIRVYPDKTTKVFPKNVAEKYPDTNVDKTYTKAGYPGNQYGPRILLAHPTLPGLDFVDMIRAHLIELCKQIFIHNVPRTEAHRYIRLLIHRLRPYLDWVYTQGKTGKKNFNPDSDKELREVVQEIHALYGRNVGRQKSVTKRIEGNQLPDTIKKVKKQIVRHLNKMKDKDERKRIQNILDHIDQDPLKDKDVEKLKDQVLSLSQREGNDWHRILLSDLHHPVSLKQVVFAGDKMLEEPSPVLIVGELPVGKRTGQIDITFFLRREIPGRTIMTPVLILEIKSKTGFNYNLYSVRTRNKKKNDYGPRFHASKRRLSDSEWKRIINAKPAKNTTIQLDAYEKLLVQEYKSLVPSDPTPPTNLWKGVIVLDTDQNPLEIFEAFQDLLTNLTMGLVNDMIDSTNLTSYIPDSDTPKKPLRLALLLTPSNGPSELLREMKPPETIIEDDPFRERIKDDRIVTLYVSISSATSSGNAAAWLSRNWHLLHHLRECKETSTKKTEILWLDLMGVFKNLEPDEHKKYLIKRRFGPDGLLEYKKYLIKRRFGLDELLEEGHITKKFHKQLTKLLDSISFLDLGPEIDRLLLNNSSETSDIIDIVQSKTNEDSDTEKIIVLDGWTELKNLVPREQKQLVRSLERTLLDILPEKNTNIIWIDSGVQHTRMNPRYQRKCIKPLLHDSHKRTHLDEIIYNAPSTPRLFGWQIPRREDARIIIQDTPTSADPWARTIDVPHLRDLAKKIRGISKRDGLVPEEDLVQSTRLSSMYGRGVTLSSVVANMSPLLDETIRQLEQDSMTLVPSVLRQRGMEPEEEKEEKEEESPRCIEVETVTSPMKTVSLTERMVLCPEQPPPYLPRAKEPYHEASKITRGWCYDSFPEEDDEEISPVSRPPLIESAPSSDIETAESRELELRRLSYTAQFLMRIIPDYENLYQCCERITKLCTKALKKEKSMQDHLTTLRDMKNIVFRESGMRQVWDRLVEVRSELINLLNSENKKTLEETLAHTSDVLELYGNNLFLTICSVLNELVPQEQQLPMATQLWSVVAEWISYQLGFKAQESEVKTKYDLQTIHSNLRQRTKFLLDKTPSVQKPVAQEYGQILWSEDEAVFEAWVVFQDEEEMVGGLTKSLQEPLLRSKWYDCVKEIKEQRRSATQALGIINRTPLISHQHGDKTILWILTEFDEEETAWVAFLIEYPVQPYRKSSLLPWFNLSEVPIEILSELQPPAHMELPTYAEKNVDRFLQSVTGKIGEPINVTIQVSADTEKEVYVAKFFEKKKLFETLKYADTKSLVRTLRHPIRLGSGLETSKGQLLMWDHRADIDFINVEVERGAEMETVSLSILKPLVHHSRFLPDEFYVPATCSELMSTKKGDRLTLTIQSEDSTFRSLSVKLDDDIPADSSLKALETLGVNIFALALLTECEQLIDHKTMTRHSIDIDAKALLGLRFSHIDQYPRLNEAISKVPESDFDWSQESWALDFGFQGPIRTQFTWSIISSTTGRAWLNRTFTVELDYIHTLEEILTEFRKRVIQTIPLEHLSGLEEQLETLEGVLQGRGWSDVPYSRTAQLEVTEKGVCVVISQLTEVDTLLEVDRLYIARDEIEDFASGLDEEYHSFNQYNVDNKDELKEAISMYLEGALDDGKDEEVSEEVELLQVIQEVRDEDKPHMRSFLGKCLVDLALLHLSQDRTEKIMSMTEEALEIFRGCDRDNSIVRLYLAKGLTVKAELLLREEGEKNLVENLLQEAKTLVTTLIVRGKPDASVQEIKKRIDRLFQENDGQET